MYSFTCTIALATCLLPLGVKGWAREGADWRYFEDFFEDMEEKFVSDDHQDFNDQTVKDTRQSTFWNVKKAGNFYWTEGEDYSFESIETTMMGRLDENKDQCGVVMLFPNMIKRAEQFKDNDKEKYKIFETYGKPLAIAPFCGDDAIPEDGFSKYYAVPQDEDFGIRPLVFHNLRKDISQELYFILKGPISNDREVDGFTMDNWKTQAILWPDERFTQKTEAGKIWNETLKDSNRALDAEYVREWVKPYAETKPDGMIPNPFKHGISSNVWPDWTDLNNFWGYNADGIIIDKPRTKKQAKDDILNQDSD